jgi:hypothetical protein
MNNNRPEAAASEIQQASDSETPMTKWWVVLNDGNPNGPHSAAYVAMMLGAGRCKPTTLVCQVGNTEWQAVKDVPELVAVAEAQSPGSLPPPVPASKGTSERIRGFFGRFTNPELPWFANWICIFCILIAPGLFVAGTLATVGIGSTASYLRHESPLIGWAVTYDVLTFIADTGVTLVLVLGGIMLCRLYRSGLSLVRTGIVLNLSWGVVSLICYVLWQAIVAVGDQALPVSDEFSVGEMLLMPFFLVLLVGGIASIVFQVVALVWLFQNEIRLPLQEPISVPSTSETVL